MLRPAVQPGSTIGYRLPDEEVTLDDRRVRTDRREDARPSGSSSGGDGGRHRVRITVTPKERQPIPLEITLATGRAPRPRNRLDDPRGRSARGPAAATHAAPVGDAGDGRRTSSSEREIPELKGGDWARGRALFYGEAAKCSTCHKVRGRGGEIGPDLSNLIHRDYASVYRDIHTPSAAINPDYVAHCVALTDGRVLQGTLRTEGDRLIVGDTDGKQTAVNRAEVEATSPSTTSIMPEGLDTALGAGATARPADVPPDRPAEPGAARGRRRAAASSPGRDRRRA